jgi:hypothetical protein
MRTFEDERVASGVVQNSCIHQLCYEEEPE